MVLSLFPAPVCLSSELLLVWCKVRAEVWSLGASSERFDIKSYVSSSASVGCYHSSTMMKHIWAEAWKCLWELEMRGAVHMDAWTSCMCVLVCTLERHGCMNKPTIHTGDKCFAAVSGSFFFFNSTEYSLKPGVRCMLSSSGICRRLLALLCVCVWTSFVVYIPRCVFLLTVKPLFSCISNTDADSLRMCIWPVLITSSLTLFTPSPFPKQLCLSFLHFLSLKLSLRFPS